MELGDRRLGQRDAALVEHDRDHGGGEVHREEGEGDRRGAREDRLTWIVVEPRPVGGTGDRRRRRLQNATRALCEP
jgi:hypothetical protein